MPFLWICLSLGVLLRAYHQLIPWGAPFLPFLFSRQGPVLESPDGRVQLRVVFNDAGAAHSGHHWTWIITDSWLMGPRVVAEGYCDARIAVDGEVFPATWIAPGNLAITFCPDRHGEAEHRTVVSF